jgi:hypothetical protein
MPFPNPLLRPFVEKVTEKSFDKGLFWGIFAGVMVTHFYKEDQYKKLQTKYYITGRTHARVEVHPDGEVSQHSKAPSVPYDMHGPKSVSPPHGSSREAK